MIVPNMSLSEIRKSVFDDFACEINSKIHALKITYYGKWIRNGRKDFVETIRFPARSKNNWRITVASDKNGVQAIPYLISYNNIGITASQISSDFDPMPLMHFNTHFFKRYRQRGNIAIEKPEDLVKFFFRKNVVLLPCYFARENGTQQLFTPLAGGVGLGDYHEDANICEFKTFVDNSLLRQDQKDQIDTIWADTITELTAEMNRRIDKKQARFIS
ncbi:MAG: hypothetical protein M3139_04355 [Bacteroidota bacterium]|nr:hypothetical protein [Bacteroidota bacterium]